MTTPRSRPSGLPNANNPRLVMRLVGLVAAGVRRVPALADVLEVEPRTVHYYIQATEWLGLISGEADLRLTRKGLELAYAPPGRRMALFAEALRRIPVAAELLDQSPDPSVEEALAIVVREEPELAESTARRRASALLGLLAPAIKLAKKPVAPAAVQLELPFPAGGEEPDRALPVDLQAGLDRNPDLYARVLDALLDEGELASHQLRALLDEAGAKDAGLGSYAEMAVQRGDAHRVGDRLVASPGASRRRIVAGDGLLVALSEPAYRQRLEALEAGESPREPGPWSRVWDSRVFGGPLPADHIAEALSELILGAPLRQLPRAGEAGLPVAVTDQPFIEVLATPSLPIALPGNLRELAAGLPAANLLLKRQKQAPLGVRCPDALTVRARVHGGLLHPGEPAPGLVPDQFSLRQRALSCCPAFALLGGLLTLARRPEVQLRVERHPAGLILRLRGRPRGRLGPLIEDFCAAQGWLLFRRPGRSLGSGELERVARALGICVRVGRVVVLEEHLFARLQEDPEAGPTYEGLLELADRWQAFLEGATAEVGP